MSKFGIPYQGSKSKIIDQIAMCIPGATHFYDLFGGGFAATHYMMLRRSQSFDIFHYNELRPGLPDLIVDAIKGKYSYKNFTPEWISRERFHAEKESNPYIKIIWSFGNNGDSYLFGEDIEDQKRSMHMAVVYDEFDDLFVKNFNFKEWPKSLKSINGKRLFLKEANRRNINGFRKDLQQLQQLERLQRLDSIKNVPFYKLKTSNSSYLDVLIEKNSVIYCDPPYKGTADYGNEFDHDQFFEWSASHKTPVFISEYNIEHKWIHLLKTIKHRSSFSKDANNPVIEKLYCNQAALDYIRSPKKQKTKIRKSSEK